MLYNFTLLTDKNIPFKNTNKKYLLVPFKIVIVLKIYSI